MEKKYRVGLIGVGSIAHIAHLPILAARNDVEMTGAFAEHIGSVQCTQQSYAIQDWTAPLSSHPRQSTPSR